MYKKFNRNRLRKAIRGFNLLKTKKNLGLVRCIHAELANTPLLCNELISSNLIIGKSYFRNEEIARQFLIENLISSNFNKAIFRSIGGNEDLIYPLPLVWINKLKRCGLKVNVMLSTILWHLYIYKKIINAIFLYCKIIYAGIVNAIGGLKKFAQNNYVYIFGLSTQNLPPRDHIGTPYDFCSWYVSSSCWDYKNTTIQHDVDAGIRNYNNVQVQTGPHPYFLLMKFREVIHFSYLGFFLISTALLNIFLGSWWSCLMSAELVKLLSVKIIPKDRLASEYLFPFSYSLYRPIWTYEAESCDTKIICFFYSTFEHPSLNHGVDDPLRSIFRLASWPKYLVWDKYQDDMLSRELAYSYNSEIVGPIAFSSDDSVAFECLTPKCIAVFDIEVYRFSAHFPVSTYAEFYCAHPDFSERFIMDIQTVLQEFSLSMAFKPKRPSYIRSRKSYLNLLKRIKNKENVRIVPSELSPLRLINECIGVISMPFTSTALYYRHQNNKSIYYDPTGWFQKDDQAAHGISIISGIDELRAWVSTNFLKLGG